VETKPTERRFSAGKYLVSQKHSAHEHQADSSLHAGSTM
jgi:hypothetical protein